MKKEEIYQSLKNIIDDIKGEIVISNETALIDGGIMDSLDVINYLTQIEETFNIVVSMDKLVENKLGIIGNMVDFIESNLNIL
ncbi:MAG: phosphopantetheine-binding protein [Candidatus Kapabacteria bacterium]|nr:phosphopantetheine-binding protein [Candidatus Kapabacteria bacterium]